MTRKSTTVLGLAACIAALAVAGCGGGDDAPMPVAPPPGSEVPSTALSSSEGLVAYVRELIATMTSATADPVVLGDITLPTSDTLDAFPVQ